MSDEDEKQPAKEETYLGHPITKLPPAYAEGAQRGPSAKPRPHKKSE